MPDLIPNQSLGSMFAQNLGSGLGEGLKALAENKLKEIHRGKNAQSFQKAFNVSPELAESLAHLQQESPGTFHHLLDNLGGGIPNAQQPGIEGQQQYNQFVPGKKVAEDKEARKGVNKFLDTFSKNYKAQNDLGSLAEHALKTLREAKADLPSFPFNLVSQKYNPLASAKVRNLERLYEKIVGKVAAAEAANTGFKAGGILSGLARASKSALDQPYETQEEALQELIDERNKARSTERTILDLKSKNGGKPPLDLEDRLAEMELSGIPLVSQQQEQSVKASVGPKGKRAKSKSTGKFYDWNPVTQKYDIEVS